MTSKTFIPVNTRHPAGTKEHHVAGYTKTGRARIIATYHGATDIPAVGRFATENTIKVHSGRVQGVLEPPGSAKPPPWRTCPGLGLAADAADANALTIDQAAWLGDTDHGINGF